MSTLVIQIPSRTRWRTGGEDALAGEPAAAEYPYVLSQSGLSVDAQGTCAPALFPRADSIVAVLADSDVSWHRIILPKAPAARLRAALSGVLEEAVLADADTLHFAVEPDAKAGASTWVAAVDREWLRGELATLERANAFVDRVVPASWPDDPPSGHFSEASAENGTADGILLNWSAMDGVVALRLQGGLAKALIPATANPEARWSATPGAAAAAEDWLGRTVNVMTPPQRLLQAARTLWNLRQFDLARRNRGLRAARDVFRQLMSRAWRPLRWGVAALVVVQILGLNLWAWHQGRVVRERHEQQLAVLKDAFPGVGAVLDAPLTMEREAQRLRTAAGASSDTDIEPMLHAAAFAWPPGRPPIDDLRFEPGRLSLAAAGWMDPQVEQFRGALQPLGWQVQSADGRVTLSRAPAGGLR